MNPEQVAASPNRTPPTAHKSNALPIMLMVWPMALLVLGLLFYAALSFLFPDDPQAFTPNPFKTALNITLFLSGAVAIALGPISFIVDLVLLIKNNRH